MHIDVCGTGPDLVMIHGWAMHGGIFAPLSDALLADFRVHRVDLPGHGFSRALPATDIATTARNIAVQTPPAIWLGWSLGGLVALRAALDMPERVNALVMVASSPRFVRAPDWPDGIATYVFTQFADSLGNDYHATIARFLALETLGSPNAQAELRELKAHVFERGEPDPAVLREGLATLESTDVRSELAGLVVPSLWISGRRDRLVSPRAMQRAAHIASRSRSLEINAGHAPFLEHATEVADAIREFVRMSVPA